MESIISKNTVNNRPFEIYGWAVGNTKTHVRGRYNDGEMEHRASVPIGRFGMVSKKKIESAHRANGEMGLGASLKKKHIEEKGGVYVPMLEKGFQLPIPDYSNDEIKSCVFNLYYGERYVVIKAKYKAFSLKLFNDGYNGFHNAPDNHTSTSGHHHFYFKIYKYIRSHWGKFDFRVEVALVSDDPYELLVKEQELLDAGRRKPKMLNSNIMAYIPEKADWISEADKTKFKLLFF